MQAKLQQLFRHQYAAPIAAMLIALLAVIFDVMEMPSLVSIANLLAALLVGVATLHRGTKAGAMVMAWAILPTLSTLAARYLSMADSLLVVAILTWGMALLVRRGMSWLNLLGTLCIGAMLLMAVIHLGFPWVVTKLEHLADIKQTIAKVPEFYAQFHIQVQPLTAEQINLTQALADRFLLGFGFAIIILQIVLVMLMMQSLYNWVFAKTSGHADFLQLRIPMIVSLVWMLCLVMSVNSSLFVFADFVPLGMVALVFAGFSWLNSYIRHNPKRQWLLMGFYVMLVFMLPIAMLLLFIVGLVDSFVNFRRVWQRRQTYSMH